MTIAFRKSEFFNGLDSGGGILSTTTIINNSSGNIHPAVTNAERLAGKDEYRKLFIHKISGSSQDGIFFLDKTSEGGDDFAIALGTVDDVVTDAKSFQNWYRVGELATAIDTAGIAGSLNVTFVTTAGIYHDERIALINWTDLSTTGVASIEIATIDTTANNGITWTGSSEGGEAHIILSSADLESTYAVKTKGAVIGSNSEPFAGLDDTYLIIDVNSQIHTVTLGDTNTAAGVVGYCNSIFASLGDHGTAIVTPAGQVTLENNRYYSNNYIQVTGGDARTIIGFSTDPSTSTDGTFVAGILEVGTLVTSHSTPSVVSSTGGDFDDSNYPIVCYDLGTVYDSWTLTFSNSKAFTISGVRRGNIGSGTIDNTFAIANRGEYFFLIKPASFNNSFAAGDTISWLTYPSAKAIWSWQHVPTGISSWAANQVSYSFQDNE